MLGVHPSGGILGATIDGLDLGQPLSHQAFIAVVHALATHGVICFPRQTLDAAALRRFSARFGSLEVNVTGKFQVPGMPEVMVLSNMVENGAPLGLADAGQDWHTDMSYSSTVAFANVLHALRVPRREGKALGATLFADMAGAYDDLPASLKERLRDAVVLHDFVKLYDRLRARPGSLRPPLTDVQRRQKPPVRHPVFLRHPVSGRMVLYANPGYATRIDGIPQAESEELLELLFAHQLQPKYQYAHEWSEGDVLMWDDLRTLHKAVADYRNDEPRLVHRCQVMADRVFEPTFLSAAPSVAPQIAQ